MCDGQAGREQLLARHNMATHRSDSVGKLLNRDTPSQADGILQGTRTSKYYYLKLCPTAC